MCGIIGIIGKPYLTEDHYQAFVNAWEMAQDRGRDACGYIAAYDDGYSWWKSAVDSGTGAQIFQDQFPYAKNIKFILAHTRFATSGAPSDNKNNHPLVIGRNKELMGIHNGMIWNKESLLETHKIKSDREVDTEIAFRLIAKYGAQSLKPFAQLRGSFNLAYCERKHTDRFYLVKHDNPLTIRKGEDYTAFGSMMRYWGNLPGDDSHPEDDTHMTITADKIRTRKFAMPKERSWRDSGAGYTPTGRPVLQLERYKNYGGKGAAYKWNDKQREWDVQAEPEAQEWHDMDEGDHRLSDGDGLVFNPETGTMERRRDVWPH